MPQYAFGKTVATPYEETLERAAAALRLVDQPGIGAVAYEVRERLLRVLAAL